MELAKIKVSGVHAAPVCLREIPAGIIGATVRFEYTDTLWDGLSKTVVFRGCVTKDVLNAGEVVTIPPEAVAKAGQRLYVGVYGTDTDENQAIPTLWADLGRIRAAADPSGDMSTDPTLPVWTQLQEQIDDLKGNGTPGGGGISQETDPTVPAWAKQPQKPTYTALEVEALPADTKIPQKPEDIGAQPSGNYALKSEIPSVPVQSVNGKTGAVQLSASDVGARPDNWMPTAQEVGALPSTYTPPDQTAEQVGADPKGTAASAVSQHNTAEDSHNDIRLELKAINDRMTAFFDSDNQTLDELSEIVAYITSNKTLIDSITTSKVSVTDIINNLTTNVSNKPLSAAQGVVLKGLIDTLSNNLANYQPKGDYALRSELPAVPTKVSAFTNDAGYLTQHQDISGLAKKSETVSVNAQTLTEAQKAQARENIGVSANGVADGSITPEKTSFIVCEGTGEIETVITPNFTNMVDPTSSDFQVGKRYNASGDIASSSYDNTTCFVSNMFPIKAGDVLRIKGVAGSTSTNATAPVFVAARLDDNGTKLLNAHCLFLAQPLGANCTDAQKCWDATETDENGVITWVYGLQNGGGNAANGTYKPTYTRIAGVATNGIENVIVTVNEEITYTEVTSGEKTYTLDEKVIVPRAECLKSGAKWFALGDSITEGWTSAVDASASSGYKQFLNTNEAERWVNIVAEMNGYELTNYGMGGTGYAYAKSGTVNARAQVANIDFSQCDFVTLAYGVNDWKGKATLGSMDDDVDTVDAFVPNMRYVIRKILTDNPYCKIFVITPLNCRSLGTYDTNYGINYAKPENASGPGLEDIFQLEKTVCEYHGIELIDMTHCSIINRENIKTMLPDYVHPTVECHRMLARELAQKITFR